MIWIALHHHYAGRRALLAAAREAGFVQMDLAGVYENRPPSTLWISDNDGHPNALGSRLIADKLLRLLREKATELQLGLEP